MAKKQYTPSPWASMRRTLGFKPYRWRVQFLRTGEIAEQEKDFRSPERAFYDLQDYLMRRVQKGINKTTDLVTLQIQNMATGEMIDRVEKRQLGPEIKRTVGYLVAELLGYEV